ncbi:MAG TPA: peptidylprolyl isomerase [Verrucomicrobiae bacterium]|nr:peptidylprolyl isomerase [Verrucomicrobiae bacterium]
MKQLFSTALIAVTAISAMAVANPMAGTGTNSMPAVVATNSSPEATMAALFGDDVIAKGKGFEIKRSELDKIMSGIKGEAASRGQTLSAAETKLLEGQMLHQLITIQLLSQKATDADKAEGKKKADEQFAALVARAGSESAFDMQLKAAGISKDDLHDTAIKNSTAMAALQRELGVNVSDKEIKEFYSSNSAAFEVPETIRARHILFSTMDLATGTQLSEDAAKAKRKQADDVLKRIRAGEDFSKLATQYSDDASTKDDGGMLPAASRNQLLQAFGLPFEEAAFTLKTNQVSDVVTANYGYHIIQLLGRNPAKTLTLTDAVPSATNMTVSALIKDRLTAQKVAKAAPSYVDKLEKDANVQIVDPKLKEAVDAVNAAANDTNAPAEMP